jgi:SAM-dependent methyltransferase
MPDRTTLARMYGPAYETGFENDPDIEDPKEPARAVRWLAGAQRGCFIDYGCGEGRLLLAAREQGWQAVGVEFDNAVARRVADRTGCDVVSVEALGRLQSLKADVVHVGDVIEHLTNMDDSMPLIMNLLKPGGVLLAQGPLEANANLFTWCLRVRGCFRRKPSSMPPYHVVLATRTGQRLLFERFGLDELQFSIHETAWPAPARLSLRVLKEPRAAALFVLRRLSQLVTRLGPRRWGNRYFYAGCVRSV